MPPLTATKSGVRIAVHVQPRASKSELVGLHGDAIRVRLAAAPVDGAANAALVDFLADVLRVSRADVAVVAGLTARRKAVTVRGLTPAEAARRLHLGG